MPNPRTKLTFIRRLCKDKSHKKTLTSASKSTKQNPRAKRSDFFSALAGVFCPGFSGGCNWRFEVQWQRARKTRVFDVWLGRMTVTRRVIWQLWVTTVLEMNCELLQSGPRGRCVQVYTFGQNIAIFIKTNWSIWPRNPFFCNILCTQHPIYLDISQFRARKGPQTYAKLSRLFDLQIYYRKYSLHTTSSIIVYIPFLCPTGPMDISKSAY